MTEKVIAGTLEKSGVDKDNAKLVGSLGNAAIGIFGTWGAGAAGKAAGAPRVLNIPVTMPSLAVVGQALMVVGVRIGTIQIGLNAAVVGTGAVAAQIPTIMMVVANAKSPKAEVPKQVHHAIPHNNSKFEHHEHDLVKAARVRLKDYGPNKKPLMNHSGGHTDEYHEGVQAILDAAYGRFLASGDLSVENAVKHLDAAIATIWRKIRDGTLCPYDSNEVWWPR